MKPFSDLFELSNGVNADKASYGQGLPFINVLEPITHSHLYGPEITGQVTLPEAIAVSYAVRRGDVLFNRTSETQDEVGLAATYLGTELVVFGGFVIRGRPTGQSFDPVYSGYALRAPIIRSQIIPMGQGAIRANIGQQNLGLVVAPVPPLPEQRAIATALGDMDALLGGLDSLIAKKRDLKQAAMQQLLTGQIRLPGFDGEWSRTELKQLVLIPITDGPHMTPRFYNSGVPFLSVNNLVDNRIDLTDLRYISKVDDQIFAKKCKPRVGDVLLGKAASVGKVAIVEEEFDFNIWSPIALVRANEEIHAKFLYYQLLSTDCVGQISLLTNSSSQGNIGMGDIEKLQISYPEREEQTAIAAALSDMDAELAALEARRDKTRNLKQVMLQELLTGRTRLIEPASKVIAVDFSAKPKPAAVQQPAAGTHNWAINEAVVVAVLVKQFGSEQYPLGRKRCTKLSYLMHRHVEHVAQGYLKKAAGPYNPSVKYKGPEGIAQKNGYIRTHSQGKFAGFVAAGKIAQAEGYFEKWYGADVLAWLEQFRYKSNDELELLATVDMAVEDLRRTGKPANVDAVKSVIHDNPEWEAKLEREIFSGANIARAIAQTRELFH
ncbi:restriction endonuclease subunit S [Polaromonas sp. YR568]|uniref:restriction endonuclease subunit S n=1 Tax=Polaromonas sp. YR568 TaxID=1855301 RepID=UPI00398BDB86